jgi:hypothetical protein
MIISKLAIITSDKIYDVQNFDDITMIPSNCFYSSPSKRISKITGSPSAERSATGGFLNDG